MAATIGLLNSAQLRTLAEVIYYQEAENTKNIIFKSEPEMAEYLQTSKSNYESILRLLDDADDVKSSFDKGSTQGSIAEDINGYAVNATNIALQIVKNFTLRKTYLDNLKEHAGTLIVSVKELDPANPVVVKDLTDETTLYKDATKEYIQSFAKDTASTQFSKWVKSQSYTFEDLLKWSMSDLKLPGRFKDLADTIKLEVYDNILELSKRGRVLYKKFSTSVFGKSGVLSLIQLLGTIVWDIFTADHPVAQIVHDVVVELASAGGALLGEIIGTAIATQALAGVEASAIFVAVVGFAAGLLGAFLIGALAGLLVSLIFSTAEAPLSTEGQRCYVAPMPNGEMLARQIAHQA